MAIGTTAALIGGAALGVGGSLVAANEQSDAIRDAQRAQGQSTNQALQLQRETRDMQMAAFEPFRQYGIQQANAMGEILGFNPVSDSTNFAASGAVPGANRAGGFDPYADYYDRNPDIGSPLSAANRQHLTRLGFDTNGDGELSPSEVGRAHYTMHGRAEGRTLNETDPNAPSGPPTNPDGTPITQESQQQAARERFDGSLFNQALQGQLGRASTGVDNVLSASGAGVYSGAREQAQANTAADLGMSALNAYTNFMMGSPNTTGAQGISNAAGSYGANASNLAIQQGQNAANSAYASAANTANLTNNLTNLAGFGLGAFSKPGAGFFGFGG